MAESAILELGWGIEGLRSAIARRDNIVIIDQLRFSCAVVTAVALGFTIEPTSDKNRKTESFSLSPRTFFNKPPQRVIISSPNGSYLSTVANKAKQVVYGCILNARAVGTWIDKMNENTTLIAAGETDVEKRKPFMAVKEIAKCELNPIFAYEDLLAAGAIASFSKMDKTIGCARAQNLFYNSKDHLSEEIMDTASHRYNESRGRGQDTSDCVQLNRYDIVPRLHFVNGVPEINSS